MSALVQTLCVLGLGLFWGLSPTLYKLMSNAGIPITHVIVFSGLGVGLGLAAVRWLRDRAFRINRAALRYGLVCGTLMTVPWSISLFFIAQLPVTVYAVIVATGPLWSYLLAVLLGRERPGLHRLGALLAGFLSSIVLIATRSDAQFGHLSYWALAAFVSPLLYAFYNHYAAAGWPKGMDTLTAGVVESWASAFIALPVLLAVAMPTSAGDFHWGYWALVAATVMWVIERVAFFTMIRTAGPVTTVQASYVSTPASVCFGVLVFNEAADAFLWLSLGLLMLALWLNNRAMARAAAQ